LIEKNLSFSDYRNLILESNLYISLHRSEGFGLGMAEFMGKGIPVIATNYSGNLDFMNKENSWLVDYEMVDVKDSVNSAYKRFGGLWAEPIFESFQLNFEDYLYSKNRIDKIENARRTIEAEFNSELLRDKLTSIFSKSGVL
jgi:glycosyltransferase involved in cell wall biosynthesis